MVKLPIKFKNFLLVELIFFGSRLIMKVTINFPKKEFYEFFINIKLNF